MKSSSYYSEILSDLVNLKRLEGGKELLVPKINRSKHGFSKESYIIENKKQSEYYGKEIGKYELISIPEVLILDDCQIEACTKYVISSLKDLIGKIGKKDKILVVGLGNRHISSDSLGSRVVGKINIVFEGFNSSQVMAIAPSVLGLTGIETYDIISGIVDKVKPTHIILIDSLCASDMKRLGRSIQLSNTGICPGSGIGNKRKCIDSSLAKVVVSIGVPLLIFASTFITSAFNTFNIGEDKLDSIMQTCKNIPNNTELLNFINNILNVYNARLDDMIVSTKDISESVEILSDIIATAINKVVDS